MNSTETNATPLNSTGTNATPLNSTGTNSTPLNSTETNATPLNSTGTNATPLNSTGTNATPLNSTGTNATPLYSIKPNSTTVPVFEIVPATVPASYCPAINATDAVANSSEVTEGAVVHVTCRLPSKLINPYKNGDVFTCIGGYWRPLTPTCQPGNGDSPAPIAVIVGCTLGGFVCLILVVIALIMLTKSFRESRDQRERNKEFDEKMNQIGSYLNTGFQDSVGMPVLMMDTRDPGLRGRVTQTTNNPSPSAAESDPDTLKFGADLF